MDAVRGNEEIFESDAVASDVVVEESFVQKESVSADIVTTSPDVSQSFEVFQGKHYSSNYGSRSSHEVEYSLADSVGRKAETVVQKFNRIQCELTSLVEDLDSIVKSKEDATEGSSMWNTLQTEAQQLLQKTDRVGQHPGLKMERSGVALSMPSLPMLTPTDTTTGSSSCPEVKDFSKIEALEKRVAELESMIGNRRNVTAGTLVAAVPLVQKLQKLETAVSNMSDSSLEVLQAKALVMSQELSGGGASGRRGSTSTSMASLQLYQKTANAAGLIEDLNDKVQRVECVSSDLPVLVHRLKTLEHIHSEVGGFCSRLDEVEVVTERLLEDAAQQEQVLMELTQGMSSNMKIFQENVTQIEAKLNSSS